MQIKCFIVWFGSNRSKGQNLPCLHKKAQRGRKMLPVVIVFPAGKQNNENLHSSHLKSCPKAGSMIEACEVFLSKKQQGMTLNSNQITSEVLSNRAPPISSDTSPGPLKLLCSHVLQHKHKFFLELSVYSEKFLPERHHLASICSMEQPALSIVMCNMTGIILIQKIKMQCSQCEMGLMSIRSRPGCHFPIVCSKMVSHDFKSLETEHYVNGLIEQPGDVTPLIEGEKLSAKWLSHNHAQ